MTGGTDDHVDSSVVLAQLLAEDRYPAESFWDDGPLVSSRLLEYEVWTRINARDSVPATRKTSGDHGTARLPGLAPAVLARALEPYPVPVRTLDALHLASVEFLRALGQRPSIATYDRRMIEAARAMDIPVVDP